MGPVWSVTVKQTRKMRCEAKKGEGFRRLEGEGQMLTVGQTALPGQKEQQRRD